MSLWVGRSLAAMVVVIAALLPSAPAPAADTGVTSTIGVVDPAQGRWALDGLPPFYFGNPGDLPILGDWDCDGIDTPGLYRPEDGYAYLANANRSQIADIAFFFGDEGDVPIAGDFDGDGCDTVSVYRPAEGQVFIVNRLGAGDVGLGRADHEYFFGDPGDVPFAGDFDGDGVDTIGLFRRSDGRVYLRNDHRAGTAHRTFVFGDPADRPVAGDWDGDGVDTIGIFRPGDSRFYLRNRSETGVADTVVALGDPSSLPVAGRFTAEAPLVAPAADPPSWYREPAFGTLVARVGGQPWESHLYSQLQAFSGNEEYLLTVGDFGYRVRQVADFAPVPLDTGAWIVPRWHPVLPHQVVHFDPNDDDRIRVHLTNVTTGDITTRFVFPPAYRTVRSNQSFDALSGDGRWMAGMAQRDDGTATIFALDLDEGRLGAQLAVGDLYAGPCAPDPIWGRVEPDWVGVSPLGRYLVVQWVRDGTARCSGLETFDLRTGEFVGRVADHHGHGDLGIAADGTTEFFMTTELAHPDDPDYPSLAYRILPGTATASPPVHLQVLHWANVGHISCRGPHGTCVISYGGWEGDGWWPFEQEVWMQRLDGTVLRVAHHRSTACGYWVQPRATVSGSGRYVTFASDEVQGTAGNSCAASDLGEGSVFVVDLDAGGGIAHRQPVPIP